MTRILAALLVAMPLPALAHDYQVGDLTITHPMATETPPTARTAAGYLTIENSGDTPDMLLSVEADFPSVSVHRSEMSDGVATMSPVAQLEVAAGETVTFEPGGLHVMFMGLEEPFVSGDSIPATLVFERAGPVEVDFHVEARGDAHMGHDGHEMN